MKKKLERKIILGLNTFSLILNGALIIICMRGTLNLIVLVQNIDIMTNQLLYFIVMATFCLLGIAFLSINRFANNCCEILGINI